MWYNDLLKVTSLGGGRAGSRPWPLGQAVLLACVESEHKMWMKGEYVPCCPVLWGVAQRLSTLPKDLLVHFVLHGAAPISSAHATPATAENTWFPDSLLFSEQQTHRTRSLLGLTGLALLASVERCRSTLTRDLVHKFNVNLFSLCHVLN